MSSYPLLSKTRYISGLQCHLRLWNDTFARGLAAEPDATLQAIFDTGTEVGELACERHPGGVLIAQDHRQVAEALEETQRIIQDESVPALFEAAFEHRGVLARADVIERLPEGGWRLIEVKSATRTKDVFAQDLALQLMVLLGAGLDVREAGVLTLNRDYVYDGKQLDLQALFRFHPMFALATERLARVEKRVETMLTMLAEEFAPEILPGEHCFAPYPCPYYAHCTRNQDEPEGGIEGLPGLTAHQRGQLQEAGISQITEIPDSFPLKRLQSVVRAAVLEKRAILHGDLSGMLTKIESPVRHLDFETFASAIPRFAGSHPFSVMPFLFSVHTEQDGKQPLHVDYLHENSDDPRPALVEHLLAALGDEGSVCTYSRYEHGVIRSLALAVPEHQEALDAIEDRLFDLLPVVRGSYYHPDFRGSFSIKKVLPALCPDMGYKDLAIEDGQAASVQYEVALACEDTARRQKIFEDLRAYCERDTLAMVLVKQALSEASQAPPEV